MILIFVQVGLEDEREGLRGSWGLRTSSKLDKFTLLGPYAGLDGGDDEHENEGCWDFFTHLRAAHDEP